MSFIDLASFPNSRVKSRPPTREANIYKGTLAPNTATLVRPAAPDRTYLTLSNKTGAVLLYGYTEEEAETGFELANGQAIDLESPQALYLYSVTGGDYQIDEGIG